MTKHNIVERYTDLVDSHKVWLRQFEDPALSAWETMLANQPESAIAEAWVRDYLSSQGIECNPNDVPRVGGVDFLCTFKGRQFYLEVANFDANSIGERTGLPNSVNDFKGRGVGSISSIFLNKRRKKQGQVAKYPSSSPVVLAFVCFHETATFIHFDKSGAESLVVPTTQRKIFFPTDGEGTELPPSREVPIWDSALFFKAAPQANMYMAACPEISAVLLCAAPWNYAGTSNPVAHIVLNPTATHQLDLTDCEGVAIGQLPDDWAEQDPCGWGLVWSDETELSSPA